MKEKINLIDTIKLFLFHWWKIALAAIICAVAAYFITTSYIMPTYVSRGSFYINNTGIGNSDSRPIAVNLADIASSQQLAYTCIEILSSDSFLSQVQEATGLPYTAQQIKAMTSIQSINDTEILEVRAAANYPKHAQLIVDGILELSSDEIHRVVGGGNIKIVDEALLPEYPSSPSVPRNVFLGFFFGAFLTAAIIFLIDFFDTRIKIEADLIHVKELPMLGVIPDIEYIGAEEKKE